MAKLTLEQKIAKIEDAIAKEELLIEESKKKIKKFKSELKTAKAEKEQSFANEILKLMKSKGISQENLIAQLIKWSGCRGRQSLSLSLESETFW